MCSSRVSGFSGAGTNLKVGVLIGRKAPEFFFFLGGGVVPLHFLALQVHLVVLVSAFVLASTVWSVSFFPSSAPRCPAICKSGGHVPRVPYEVGATEWIVK